MERKGRTKAARVEEKKPQIDLHSPSAAAATRSYQLERRGESGTAFILSLSFCPSLLSGLHVSFSCQNEGLSERDAVRGSSLGADPIEQNGRRNVRGAISSGKRTLVTRHADLRVES